MNQLRAKRKIVRVIVEALFAQLTGKLAVGALGLPIMFEP